MPAAERARRTPRPGQDEPELISARPDPLLPSGDRSRTPTTEFGAVLIERRTALGLSRRELAERAGISYPFLSELERGAKAPSAASLFKLAAALGVSAAELLAAAEHSGSRRRAPRPQPGPAGRAADVIDLSDLASLVRSVVREELGDAAESAPSPFSRGPASSAAAGATGSAVAAHRPDDLWRRVLDDVRDLAGDPTVEADDEGDVPLRRGDVMLFVRVLDEPPSVLVFSPVLVGVTPTTHLIERINQLNEAVRFVRFSVSGDGVVIDHELFGDPFDAMLLALACRAVSGAAERFGPELRDDFGGRLFLGGDERPAPGRDTGGYL